MAAGMAHAPVEIDGDLCGFAGHGTRHDLASKITGKDFTPQVSPVCHTGGLSGSSRYSGVAAVFDGVPDRACFTHPVVDRQSVALNLPVVHAQMLDELVGRFGVEPRGSFVIDIGVALLCRHC